MQPSNCVICGSHVPATYHLRINSIHVFFSEYYDDTSVYLSLFYQIKYTKNNTEKRMQYIFSHSPINTVVPISLAHHSYYSDSTIDLFVFNLILDTLDNGNIYLYRTINCTARFALYKVLDGPITVHESALCETLDPKDSNDSFNHNLRKEMFLAYHGRSQHLKITYLTRWTEGYVFHFTFNTSLADITALHCTQDQQSHQITVNSSHAQIYHRAWYFTSHMFLVFRMKTIRVFEGLDGACFYGGYAMQDRVNICNIIY